MAGERSELYENKPPLGGAVSIPKVVNDDEQIIYCHVDRYAASSTWSGFALSPQCLTVGERSELVKKTTSHRRGRSQYSEGWTMKNCHVMLTTLCRQRSSSVVEQHVASQSYMDD